MPGENVIALRPEQAVEIALPDLVDIGAEGKTAVFGTPQDLAARAHEHIFQIACLRFGVHIACQPRLINDFQVGNPVRALFDVLKKIGAYMRQGAAGRARQQVIVPDIRR